MPIVNGCLKLKQNAPFEEIDSIFYNQLLNGVPPARWNRPYSEGGWFFMGEPDSTDFKTGEDYYILCFHYGGRYYAGCRKIKLSNDEVEREITSFCCNLDLEGQN